MGNDAETVLLLMLLRSAMAQSGQEPIKCFSISCKVPHALNNWQEQPVSTFMVLIFKVNNIIFSFSQAGLPMTNEDWT